MKIKFVILIASILFAAVKVSGQTENFAGDETASQTRQTELEKTIGEAVKTSRFIYVAKVKSTTVIRTGTSFIGRHGETIYHWTISNRMLVEKNLKGATKKLIFLKKEFFIFKKGDSYLIFADPRNNLIKAVNLKTSAKELAIVERILSK